MTSRYRSPGWRWKGGRIVGTIAAVAEELGTEPTRLAQAIERAGLQPWGQDAHGDVVFRVLDVRELIKQHHSASRR
jgi:hypothetical protein